jgi:aminoglycoside 6'-N-acetyltransferase I
VPIRDVAPADAGRWEQLRAELWPEDAPGEHRRAIERYFQGHRHEPRHVLIAVDAGEVVGFAELSIRNIVDSCVTDRVGYLEGLYVVPAARRRGVARTLILASERWASGEGCTEFASDALIDNDASVAVHRALGFEETSRVRNFRKTIG